MALPSDILGVILSFLSVSNCGLCRRVCRQWKTKVDLLKLIPEWICASECRQVEVSFPNPHDLVLGVIPSNGDGTVELLCYNPETRVLSRFHVGNGLLTILTTVPQSFTIGDWFFCQIAPNTMHCGKLFLDLKTPKLRSEDSYPSSFILDDFVIRLQRPYYPLVLEVLDTTKKKQVSLSVKENPLEWLFNIAFIFFSPNNDGIACFSTTNVGTVERSLQIFHLSSWRTSDESSQHRHLRPIFARFLRFPFYTMYSEYLVGYDSSGPYILVYSFKTRRVLEIREPVTNPSIWNHFLVTTSLENTTQIIIFDLLDSAKVLWIGKRPFPLQNNVVEYFDGKYFVSISDKPGNMRDVRVGQFV